MTRYMNMHMLKLVSHRAPFRDQCYSYCILMIYLMPYAMNLCVFFTYTLICSLVESVLMTLFVRLRVYYSIKFSAMFRSKSILVFKQEFLRFKKRI